MLTKRIIPCLDVDRGRVVKGVSFVNLRDAGDPAEMASFYDAEGADDMPAHVRSVLTQSDLTIPVRRSSLVLGTWQGIYLWEHRTRPHRRVVVVTIVGDG